MRVFRTIKRLPATFQHSVCAIGNFDGVHLGHASILKLTCRLAHDKGVGAAALIFHPHPRHYFQPDLPPLALSTISERIPLMAQQGIACVFLMRFNQAMATMSAHSFVSDILCQQLKVTHVVVGDSFHFGKNRQGNSELLQSMGKTHGFGVSCVPTVRGSDGTFSSSAVRDFLKAGKPHKAAQLLGRPWGVQGRVCRGEARGRTLSFPTANLEMKHRFQPAFGVYAVMVEIQRHGKNHSYPGVANIGKRPTFKQDNVLLEVHILDGNHNLYGEKIRVSFIHYLRGEKTFDGLEALKKQIGKDAAQARAVLSSPTLPVT